MDPINSSIFINDTNISTLSSVYSIGRWNYSLLLTVISPIIAVLISVLVNLILLRREEKKSREATLYYPLFIACKGIKKVFNNYDTLKREGCLIHLKDSSEIFHEISRGSVRYLDRNKFDAFLKMRYEIDRALYNFGNYTWESMELKLDVDEANDEYRSLKECADVLLLECGNKVTNINKYEGQ